MGIAISVETYEPIVVKASLEAGARVLNYTVTAHQEETLQLAGAAQANVILCYVGGANVREITDLEVNKDPLPGLIECYADRIDTGKKCGVTNIIIHPDMGFYYGNLVNPEVRGRHQTHVILTSFRLRRLGYPIYQTLPHAFDLFEGELRTAEGFFAVVAILGGVNLMRTHEVARVHALLHAINSLSI